MKSILIAYATSEGHTKRIADHIAAIAGEEGTGAELLDVNNAGAAGCNLNYDAVILGASIHGGRHQKAMTKFVTTHLSRLSSVPTAFYSVSLTSAMKDSAHHVVADEMVNGFLRKVSWVPDRIWLVAGALPYTRYSPLKRIVLRAIARKEGGDVDTSQDYEYTDWDRLDDQVKEFLRHVVPVGAQEKSTIQELPA